MSKKIPTFTIGYSGRTVSEFLRVLKEARVERVVDVRALPLSRKKGFSKTVLGNALADEGIEYVHLRSAGNPYRDMKNDVKQCLRLYGNYLDAHPGILDEVEDVISDQVTALLCFEADACSCHRSIIAQRLASKNGHRGIRHL